MVSELQFVWYLPSFSSMAAAQNNETDINNVVNTAQEAVDPSHILFLHPSDNPNSILVNDLLNGKNYGTWKKSM